MDDYSGHPRGLSRNETLARLTIAEKRRIAHAAIMGFPHLDHATLDLWLRDHGDNTVQAGETLGEKTDALLDRRETLIRSGKNAEALDCFVYGRLYPTQLEVLGIDPGEVAGREPLAMRDSVCENE